MSNSWLLLPSILHTASSARFLSPPLSFYHSLPLFLCHSPSLHTLQSRLLGFLAERRDQRTKKKKKKQKVESVKDMKCATFYFSANHPHAVRIDSKQSCDSHFSSGRLWPWHIILLQCHNHRETHRVLAIYHSSLFISAFFVLNMLDQRRDAHHDKLVVYYVHMSKPSVGREHRSITAQCCCK